MDEITAAKARELVDTFGSVRGASKATGIPRTTLQRRVAGVERATYPRPTGAAHPPAPSAKRSATNVEDDTAPATGGFSLRGVSLLVERPQGTIKKRLYSLRRGMGYRVDELSKEWHVTAETLRKHAKDYDALRYVELTPGEYVACIVHPDTVKEGQA